MSCIIRHNEPPVNGIEQCYPSPPPVRSSTAVTAAYRKSRFIREMKSMLISEPEWEGYVTLEISNTTPLPAKIYANEGIAQVLFFKGEEEPEVSYKDQEGEVPGEHGVTLPQL